MRLTLNINDQKSMFFLELIRTFDFVSIETEASDELNPAHKALLDKRLMKFSSQKEDNLSWEEVQSKTPIVKIDKKLEKHRGKVLFPKKLAMANKLLEKAVLPTFE